MDRSITCRTCQYFESRDEKSPMNFCKRYPPIPVQLAVAKSGKVDLHFTFVVVSGDNCCGEHKPIEATP